MNPRIDALPPDMIADTSERTTYAAAARSVPFPVSQPVVRKTEPPAPGPCVLAVPLALIGPAIALTSVGLLLAFWIFAGTLTSLILRIKLRTKITGAFLGMLLAHAGIGEGVLALHVAVLQLGRADVHAQEDGAQFRSLHDGELA